MKSLRFFLLPILVLAGLVNANAADRLELDEISIKGASELPKVLYIVPWKKAELKDDPVKVNRLVDEVISPVDKKILQRQIRFYDTYRSK